MVDQTPQATLAYWQGHAYASDRIAFVLSSDMPTVPISVQDYLMARLELITDSGFPSILLADSQAAVSLSSQDLDEFHRGIREAIDKFLQAGNV